MSTTINEAQIKVGIDAAGVEEGGRKMDAVAARTGKSLENLGATAQKTGKSLDNLGGSAGLRTVGDGAGAAAGKVDSATKSMAESIQRATASMNAGAKGSAAYYEALANSRGLNVAALRPYLDQLDAVTKKTAQAAAAQRQLDAGNNFLAGLRAQAEGIGKTASQLAALRAEQLGVADDARPLIEQLQAAEEAAGNAGNSISGFAAALAAAGASAGIASVVQLSDAYSGYIAQLKLASSGQSEFVKAQALVQQIAASAQSDLSSTASLYASITKSTRDLGIAQSQVASITEVVSLGLKVSGASAEASGSAIYQLGQAFNMGALRGEEFNAVNDASPRLMEALADGIGVPVGALRAMAEQGALTTEVLANGLPRALEKLREEAKSVETVGGALTVLKDKTMLLVGANAQSSGVVAVLSGAIELLSKNLVLAGGAMATVAAVKLGASLASAAAGAYASVVANNARLASNLAAARSDVAATASAAALASARVAELRAAVLAAEGNVALAITTNALIPAQAKAATAASAHAAALSAQTAAAGAASVAGRALSGVMTLAGGPVGAIIGLLGVAATIWGVWASKAKEANDKVAQSTEESTAEMITRLDEQIAKLRERNALAATEPRIKDLGGISEVDKDGLARAKAALDANKAAQAAAAEGSRERMMLQLEEVELGGKYEAALNRVKTLQGEVATAAARTRGERLDDWYAKNGSAAQRLAAELAELKKQFGTIPPEMEKLVRAKYADPAAKKAITDQAKAAKEYADLIDRISGKSVGLDADFYDNLSKLYAGYTAGKQSLEEYVATVEDYTLQQQFAKQADEDRKKAIEEYQKLLDPAEKGSSKALGEARAQRDENEQIGLGAKALAELNATRLESLALRAEEKVWIAEGLDITGTMAEEYRKEAAALRERAAAVREGAAKQVTFDAAKKAGEDLEKFLDPTKAQTFGEALKGAFGAAGDSMTQLVTSLDAYGIRQAEIDKARKDASLKYATDAKGYAEASAAITAKEVKSRLSGYGDMAAAAKGFFSEGSKGYNVLSGVEKAYRAAELAMAVQAMTKKIFFKQAEVTANTALNATKITGEAAATAASTGLAATEASAWGVTAVVKAIASLPFPLNLAAGAATLAAVVAVGAKMFGGVGGSGVGLSETRQKEQGTGTVLGSDAKSESIARALDAIEGATLQGLKLSNGMLTSLRNIEAGIGQFASLLVRTTGVTGDFGSDAAGRGSADAFGRSTMGVLATGGIIGLALDKLTGGWVGKITGSVLNKVFGGKTTVEDTGFTLGKTDFAGIAAGGLNALQYADIKKDGGWFSSDKYSTKTEGLGEEGNRQISSVLMSLYDTVFEAGQMIGIGADGFAAQLNGFVVDIGKVSLKGLSDDEIQKELEAVFSKVGDDLAKFGVGGLEQFQKVGEGYLETLTRVATNYQAVTVVTDSLGMAFGSLGLASVGARERLIDLVGGLDEFTSGADQFLADFYTDQERANSLRARITPTLEQFGIKTGAEDSLQQFRSVVTGLDLTTEAGARAYATLIQIAPAFKQIADVDAKIFEERTDLQKELDQLTLTETQLLAQQRAALDESNRSLFDQIQAIKAQKTAAEQAAEAIQKARDSASSLLGGVDGAFSVLQKVVGRQKEALQDDIQARTEAVNKLKSLTEAARNSLNGMRTPEQQQASQAQARADIGAALAIARAGGGLGDTEALQKAISALGNGPSMDAYATYQDYQRDLFGTQGDLAELTKLTDGALTIEERALKAAQDQAKQLDEMLKREQEQIDVLKGLSTIGLSIEQAIKALQGAMAAARQNPVVSASAAINNAYQQHLGRAPDAAGFEWYQNAAAGGAPISQLVDSIANSAEADLKKLYQSALGRAPDAEGLAYWMNAFGPTMDAAEKAEFLKGAKPEFDAIAAGKQDEFLKLRGFAVGTNKVPYDMPALIHKDERIIPAADNRELMRRLANPAGNADALAAEVARLSAVMEAQQRENVELREALRDGLLAIATHTSNTASHLDDVVNGRKPVVTEAAATT
ncbi:tape measure protein [Massilia sp. YIM B02443]|uniref:tape measure protein n=1 Tax=Massilia sp. YIM B02443 TaxID=3050127 RepID=UPI0025B72785|nr:tape measure protein [Massilia sp. YIM B02443]MDN4040198.1 tape measure protein [Massilia sp. YIM B02443]